MDEKTAAVQMAARLVLAMDPQEAKEKLHNIVCGGDIYETILTDGTAPAPVRKRRGGRRRKKVENSETPETGQE